MKHSWEKIRLGVIARLSAVAFALSSFIFFSVFSAAPCAYSATPTATRLAKDDRTDAVTAYSAAGDGDVSPLAPPTGLASPQSVAIDASGNIYATNSYTNTITVYAKGSNGDAAPIAIIGGSNTGLRYPAGIAVGSSGKIYVADRGDLGAIRQTASVFVYSAGSNGNVAPVATISGSDTGLFLPYGIAVDSSGKIYVTDYFVQSVFVYSPGSNGNVTPIATISGLSTGLFFPLGVAVDSSGKIYVAECPACAAGVGTGGVSVYPALGSRTGLLNEAPTATVSGPLTELYSPAFTGIRPVAAAPPPRHAEEEVRVRRRIRADRSRRRER